MELDDLREKLSESEFNFVKSGFADRDKFRNQVKEARDEAIEHRHKFKEQKGTVTNLLEKLGVESIDDIDNLPDAKGQADQVKQLEIKLKRMQSDMKTQDDEYKKLSDKHQGAMKNIALKKALSAHEFNNPAVVESFINQRVSVEEDGDLIYTTDDGQVLSIDDGVSLFAKNNQDQLKHAGNGGSGNNPAARGGGTVNNPWAKDHFNLTEQSKIAKENPEMAKQLMEAAT